MPRPPRRHRRRLTRRQRLVRRALPTFTVVGLAVAVLARALLGGSVATRALHPQTALPVPSVAAASRPVGFTAAERGRLTAEIAAYLHQRDVRGAVAVEDLRTSTGYCYDCNGRFVTASVVKLDILESLLLRAQHAGQRLTAEQRALAARMIDNSDNAAATALYDEDGDNDGIGDANRALGLRHTTVAADDYWGDTTTTVSDQVRLLAAAMHPGGVLSPASRSYVRHLMGEVEADQCWGVPAAAAGGERYLVKNGWLPRDDGSARPWAVNSDGVLLGGPGLDPLAVSVLTAGSPTEAAGIATVQHLARLVSAPLRPAQTDTAKSP
jgi:hypothetical protein